MIYEPPGGFLFIKVDLMEKLCYNEAKLTRNLTIKSKSDGLGVIVFILNPSL